MDVVFFIFVLQVRQHGDYVIVGLHTDPEVNRCPDHCHDYTSSEEGLKIIPCVDYIIGLKTYAIIQKVQRLQFPNHEHP